MSSTIQVLVRGMTKMNRGKEICIGGIELSSKKHVRLVKNKDLQYEPFGSIKLLNVYEFSGEHYSSDNTVEDFQYKLIPKLINGISDTEIENLLNGVSSSSVFDHYKDIEFDKDEEVFVRTRYESQFPKITMGTFKDFKILDYDWDARSGEASIRVKFQDSQDNIFDLKYNDLQIYRYSEPLKKFVLKNSNEIEQFFNNSFKYCSLGLTREFPKKCQNCDSYKYIQDNRLKKIENPEKFGRIPDFKCNDYGHSSGCGWVFYIDGNNYANSKRVSYFRTRWLQLNTLIKADV